MCMSDTTNITLYNKEINWLTNELSNINYSTDKQKAILYELGLLRSIVARCIHNDSNNVAIVKMAIRNNPHYSNSNNN